VQAQLVGGKDDSLPGEIAVVKGRKWNKYLEFPCAIYLFNFNSYRAIGD
jgi:hypothetical protein